MDQKEEKNHIKSDFIYVQFLDIFAREEEEDMSNFWTHRERMGYDKLMMLSLRYCDYQINFNF